MLTKVTISFLRVFCVSEDEWPLRWSHDLSKHTLASQTFVQAILDLSQTKLRPISRHLWDFSSISWSRMCKPFCIPCVHLRFLTIASPILSDSESLLVYYLQLMTIYPIFSWFWFLISIYTFFLSSLFSNFVILILTVKSRLNSYRSQFCLMHFEMKYNLKRIWSR